MQLLYHEYLSCNLDMYFIIDLIKILLPFYCLVYRYISLKIIIILLYSMQSRRSVNVGMPSKARPRAVRPKADP